MRDRVGFREMSSIPTFTSTSITCNIQVRTVRNYRESLKCAIKYKKLGAVLSKR